LGQRSLTLLVIVLLLGSAVAFAWTERLKLTPSTITAPHFDRWLSPECGCRRETAHLSFLLRRLERLDVAVVDDHDRIVATLAEGLERRRGRVDFEWDGREASDRIAPDGAYRLRVRLERAGRTILIPTEVHLDTHPPSVRLLGVSATSFALGGDGIAFRYTANEPARPILLLGDRIVFRGRLRAAGRTKLLWQGELRSRTIAPGIYQVVLAVVDRAGNRSAPTDQVTIVVV
jgi:hypothetical protein